MSTRSTNRWQRCHVFWDQASSSTPIGLGLGRYPIPPSAAIWRQDASKVSGVLE